MYFISYILKIFISHIIIFDSTAVRTAKIHYTSRKEEPSYKNIFFLLCLGGKINPNFKTLIGRL